MGVLHHTGVLAAVALLLFSGQALGADANVIQSLQDEFKNQTGTWFGPHYVQLEDDDDGAIRSAMIPLVTKAGKVLLRFINWSTNDEGVPSSGSQFRGRGTQDFKIAPFFEDIKANEFGY